LLKLAKTKPAHSWSHVHLYWYKKSPRMFVPDLTLRIPACERISAWIGAPLTDFKHVYDLWPYGLHSDHERGGTQFECPLLGAPEWLFKHEFKFTELIGFFRHGGLGFMATSSYSVGESSNSVLRRLGAEMHLPVLELNDNTRDAFRIDGFSLHRRFATLLALPPSTFKIDAPFTCCDNHRTFSALASLGGGHHVEHHPTWLKDNLYDAETYSTCRPFAKMPKGFYYKHYMRGDADPSEYDSEAETSGHVSDSDDEI